MIGGVVKMSRVASEKVKRAEVLDWQPSEEQEQAVVMEWTIIMRNQYPELDLLFHIGNGGLRSKPEAVRFKKIGVKAGVPDLFLPVARGTSHGLWIEMKRKNGGRLSDEQKAWIEALTAQHYLCVVAHGADEACDAIYRYLTGE